MFQLSHLENCSSVVNSLVEAPNPKLTDVQERDNLGNENRCQLDDRQGGELECTVQSIVGVGGLFE